MTNKDKLLRDIRLIAENHGFQTNADTYEEDCENLCIYGGSNVPTYGDVKMLVESIGNDYFYCKDCGYGIDIFWDEEWETSKANDEWVPTYEFWLRAEQMQFNQPNGTQTYNREEDHELLKEKLHNELVGDNNGLTEEEVQELFNTKDYRYIVDNYDIDGVRVCSECGGLMDSGYLIEGVLEYYCCDECLHKHYTEEEYQQMYEDDEAFYTEWY